LGLHIDLGEWAYRDAKWTQLHHVVNTENADAVASELRRQLDWFCELTGKIPTHLDSHQHVHRHEPVASVVRALMEHLFVPLRNYSSGVRYCGDFYGQTATGEPLPDAIDAKALIGILSRLPAGVTELGCHPGFDAELDT